MPTIRNPVASAPIYRIIRFYRGGRPKRTFRTGLTLAEARAHCQDPATKTLRWFDGYALMRGIKIVTDKN